MRKILSVIVVLILSVSVMSIELFAYTPSKCVYCGAAEGLVAECSGVSANYTDDANCVVAGSMYLGVQHYANCEVTRFYYKTSYRCSACGNSFLSNSFWPSDNRHICYVTHSSTSQGVYVVSTCSAYLGRTLSTDIQAVYLW